MDFEALHAGDGLAAFYVIELAPEANRVLILVPLMLHRSGRLAARLFP
jgi:hypothetical protein